MAGRIADCYEARIGRCYRPLSAVGTPPHAEIDCVAVHCFRRGPSGKAPQRPTESVQIHGHRTAAVHHVVALVIHVARGLSVRSQTLPAKPRYSALWKYADHRLCYRGRSVVGEVAGIQGRDLPGARTGRRRRHCCRSRRLMLPSVRHSRTVEPIQHRARNSLPL